MKHLNLTAMRMESAPFRAREFIKKMAPIIADRTIGEGIRNVARQQKMPERYAQSLHFDMEGMTLICWVDLLLDGEVTVTVSGVHCLVSAIDFMFLAGVSSWPKTREEFDELFPVIKPSAPSKWFYGMIKGIL